jgi:hypothetical protein
MSKCEMRNCSRIAKTYLSRHDKLVCYHHAAMLAEKQNPVPTKDEKTTMLRSELDEDEIVKGGRT